MSHWYTDTPIHGIPSLYILFSSLHGCSVHSYIMFTHHCYTCLYCFYILVRWITVHIACLLLHVYSCIPVAWLFPVTNIPVTGYVSYWYTMCGLPHLLFSVSRYLILCYQQSSGHVIMLHVPCIILVLAMQCTLHIMNITWGWGRLDGWLDLIGWMYWNHIYPTTGMVVLPTNCI